jgi:hypothetical protein
MINYESDDWNIKPLFLASGAALTVAEYVYRKEVGDDFAEKFKKEIIEYGKNVYKDYQTKLQEVHKKLPKQYARRLDELLQKINDFNSYKNEPTSLDLSNWIDIYNSTFVYGLMNSIINSIIKHAKGNEIKKIPNVLEYLSKPDVYKALLKIYILKYYNAMRNYRVQPGYENLEQIKYLKASNDTQKYMEATQNFFQEVIEGMNSFLQDASKYIEDTIERLFYVDKKHFDVVLGVKIIDTLAELYKY